eukprot:800359-Prymnesium_polylepis.1
MACCSVEAPRVGDRLQLKYTGEYGGWYWGRVVKLKPLMTSAASCCRGHGAGEGSNVAAEFMMEAVGRWPQLTERFDLRTVKWRRQQSGPCTARSKGPRDGDKGRRDDTTPAQEPIADKAAAERTSAERARRLEARAEARAEAQAVSAKGHDKQRSQQTIPKAEAAGAESVPAASTAESVPAPSAADSTAAAPAAAPAPAADEWWLEGDRAAPKPPPDHRTAARRPPPKPAAVCFREPLSSEVASALIGTRVRLWWASDSTWFVGRVARYDAAGDAHLVAYDDGERKLHVLRVETWQVEEALEAAGGASHSGDGEREREAGGAKGGGGGGRP